MTRINENLGRCCGDKLFLHATAPFGRVSRGFHFEWFEVLAWIPEIGF